jgi:hypothetical protein
MHSECYETAIAKWDMNRFNPQLIALGRVPSNTATTEFPIIFSAQTKPTKIMRTRKCIQIPNVGLLENWRELFEDLRGLQSVQIKRGREEEPLLAPFVFFWCFPCTQSLVKTRHSEPSMSCELGLTWRFEAFISSESDPGTKELCLIWTLETSSQCMSSIRWGRTEFFMTKTTFRKTRFLWPSLSLRPRLKLTSKTHVNQTI